MARQCYAIMQSASVKIMKSIEDLENSLKLNRLKVRKKMRQK